MLLGNGCKVVNYKNVQLKKVLQHNRALPRFYDQIFMALLWSY